MNAIEPKNNHRVMIYVQHLLGIGHLRRSWFLACALADINISVDFVSGGMPISGLSRLGINFHQLPPVRSLNDRFDQLVNEQDQPISEQWRINRRNQLLAIYHATMPRLLITETFPFGRRMMRFELLPLLQASQANSTPPIIVSSIRDILQPKSKSGRNEEVLDWINRYYDHVLIHGDPKIANLELCFPLSKQIESKLFYSGYISNTQASTSNTPDGHDDVIISGGGGAASFNLLKTAIAARALSALNSKVWRILVGNNLNQTKFDELQQLAGQGIIVERNRSDFQQLLAQCTVSVSQAGYNTVMDLLRQQTAAVLVPFAEADEIEQSLRAEQLAKIGRVVTLAENKMTPQSLAQAIDKASRSPKRNLVFSLDGAQRSAEKISSWMHD